MENKEIKKQETKEPLKKCPLCHADIKEPHEFSVLDDNGNFTTVCFECYKKSFDDGEWWY